jgi:predicted PurR-regulated permease PerM
LSAASARSLRAFAWMRRFAKLWGFALFCIFVVYVFRHVALPFLFAILVAYILAPAVDRMARLRVLGRPFPRGLAVIILYINILAALGLFIGYFIPKLSGDFARLFREAPMLTRRLNEEWLPRIGGWVDERFGAGAPAAGEVERKPTPPRRNDIVWEPLPDGKFRLDLSGLNLEVQPLSEGRFIIAPPKRLDEGENHGEGRWERSIKQWIAEQLKSGEDQSRRALEYGQKFVTGVVTGVARLVLVLMVAAFILIDLGRVRRFLRSLVPDTYAQDYDRIAHGIDRGLSGVIRGQLLICLINGVFTYIGLVIFDVKYSLLLAGVACVMSLVPIFGSVLSSIPIVAIALVSSGRFDVRQGLYVLGWILLIHFIEANFLNPKIMGDAARIHPVVVVFALVAGEYTYGLVGALFAVPVASIIQTLFTYFRRRDYARPEGAAGG